MRKLKKGKLGFSLSAVKDAEDKLKGDAIHGLIGGFPPGHPVLLAREKARQKGHIVSNTGLIGEEEQTLMEQQVQEIKKRLQESRSKQDEKKEQSREAKVQQEKDEEVQKEAKKYVGSIEESKNRIIIEAKKMVDKIKEDRRVIAGDAVMLMKVARLERLLFMMIQGLASNKF